MFLPNNIRKGSYISRVTMCVFVLMLVASFLISTSNTSAKQATANANTLLQTHDFTPVSQSHSSTNYLNVVEQSLIAAEGVKLSVYDDGKGIPTIGIGYNLKVRPILDAVVTSFGADPSKLSTKNQVILTDYINQMASDINSFTTGDDLKTLQDSLNKQLVQIGKLFAAGVVQSVFAFANSGKAERLFDTIYNNLSFESNLSSALGKSNFNDSLERAALISLAYNGVKIKGTNMLSDIQKNNRAEVWYEIRSDSNAANNLLSGKYDKKIASGLARRRDYESDLFGLYDGDPFKPANPSPVTNVEAAQIFNMVLAHETTVFQSVLPIAGKPDFNNQYFVNPDTLIVAANGDYKTPIGVVKNTTALSEPEPDFAVRNLVDSFAPAVDYLLTDAHATNTGHVFVYNQPGSQIQASIDLTKIGQTTPIAVFLQNNGGINQQIIMNAASDLVYAQSNSTVTLGQGVDQLTLRGTTNTVDATQLASTTNLPIDTITFAGKLIAGNIPSSGIYNGAMYVLNGTTLVITSGGKTLTIKGFHSGNFGVKIAQSTPPSSAKVVFSGKDTNGYLELWQTNGTASGTTKLTTIQNSTGLAPFDITPFGNHQALFRGADANNKYQLWITNGLLGGTIQLTNASSSSFDPKDIAVFGNEAVFEGWFNQLWATNGTLSGTHQLTNITNFNILTLNPDITSLGNRALFNGFDTSGNAELWETDGTAANTTELTTPTHGFYSLFSPSDITVFGKGALFNGYDTHGKSELWATDGVPSGTTTELTNITYGSFGSLSPDHITVFGSQALFYGRDTNGQGQMWVTDGVPGGSTTQLTNIPSAIYNGLNPTTITVIGKQALFDGSDANGLDQLWSTNGTPASTKVLTPIQDAYSVGITPSELTPL